MIYNAFRVFATVNSISFDEFENVIPNIKGVSLEWKEHNEYLNFLHDKEEKLFYPSTGSFNTLASFALRPYTYEEIFIFFNDAKTSFEFDKIINYSKEVFSTFHVKYYVDYIKILKILEEKGETKLSQSNNFLSESGLVFTWNNAKYEADCLGILINQELTDQVLAKFRSL